ncbi:MAG TPA: nuclear transport factor 2 family protein [Methylibium sp.]|jgi:predicted SnoaL-like aldol condensation-catalyzing enzyme|uniref:nuclear transport factor 2 family protein n=1 Tax=Methylibium sp. TaxID=2067992 RepID=UPI002DBFF6B2|nr:nuclear transport factor 2 family protein [Methylibium sp.]HEU4459756.1 nuclear transport factor 2 family protein [Methylibium sp.]
MLSIARVRALAVGALVALASLGAHALTAQEQANKDVVLAFYEAAINQKDIDAAVAHIGPKYIQHNPRAADGVEGLKSFIGGYLKKANPQLKASIKRVIVQGDLVVLHVHSVPEPGALGTALVDIFRLENGKIVEHWDVQQPVPEKLPHGNTMF